jgi:RNA polymerase sigma-70 factor (ECF subfamily)
MTGSIMDGEDVVQEALFNAYRRLETLEEGRPIAPWLFQIAHNRAIDFIRRRDVRAKTELAAAQPEGRQVDKDDDIRQAIEHLVLVLPPKERACVLLKEVLDYSLEETATIIDSTAGAVKSALHRARAKLAKPGAPIAPAPKPHAPELAILRLYVERFNRQDWEGVRELIVADANLLVADRFLGPLSQAPYFSRYAALAIPWRFEIGAVDGELALISMREENLKWIPYSAARAEVENGWITRVVDFAHCAWVLPAAQSLVVYSS